MEAKNSKRYSKQREAILQVLEGTKAHPTANTIYEEVRKEIPNVSLGTIYRNLAQLSDDGYIAKLDTKDGSERYDYNFRPHYHLYCNSCGGVFDVEIEYSSSLDKIAGEQSGAKIDYHSLVFCGLCKKCNK